MDAARLVITATRQNSNTEGGEVSRSSVRSLLGLLNELLDDECSAVMVESLNNAELADMLEVLAFANGGSVLLRHASERLRMTDDSPTSVT